ncbi:MAG: restriction endonuclease subunit S [Ureaplasma sp.]|nr:restriction endonuclease subunit S [Ureaplasma sp.]
MAIVRLGDICEIKVGKDCRVYNNANNFVQKSNLYYLDINYFMSISSFIIYKTNKYIIENWTDSIYDDVILCSRTGNTACNFKILKCKTVLDNRWNILIPNEKIINKKYLCYFLSNNKDKLINNLSFTTQPNITQNHLKKFLIDLIDIKEQQKIIDIIEPKEHLYKKYSNLINIDNYDSFIKSWNILIDIIEPFENKLNELTNKLNIIKNIEDRLLNYSNSIGYMIDNDINIEKGKNIESNMLTNNITNLPFVNISHINNKINKYVRSDSISANVNLGDILLSLDGTPGLVNNFVYGFNGYGYKLWSRIIDNHIIYYSLLHKHIKK